MEYVGKVGAGKNMSAIFALKRFDNIENSKLSNIVVDITADFCLIIQICTVR